MKIYPGGIGNFGVTKIGHLASYITGKAFCEGLAGAVSGQKA